MQVIVHGAAGQVTGSCFEIINQDSRIIIDCGLIQGGSVKEQENFQPFPFDPEKIDAVVLTHAHIDHSGRLPLLVKAGFQGSVYCHVANLEIIDILLSDSAYIQEKEAEWRNKKRLRKGLKPRPPLYTREDVPATLALLTPLNYDRKFKVCHNIEICLRNAGHILGSASVEVFLKHNGQSKTVIFSGDIGNAGSPIQEDPYLFNKADLVFMESTYGSRDHISWQDSITELKEVLLYARRNKGNVLIPAFAVGRTQVLLHYFATYYTDWKMHDWSIFLDSPMAIRVTKAYQRHWKFYKKKAAALWQEGNLKKNLPNLHFSASTEESMAINRINQGAIIIAGSGMMSGGRIKHHLKHNIWRQESHLIISGYQAEGTIGRRIVDGAEHIRLWGETIKVAANVHTIGGFSAHAAKSDLIQWYRNFTNEPPLYLIHGSSESLTSLQTAIDERVPNKVKIAKKGEIINIK